MISGLISNGVRFVSEKQTWIDLKGYIIGSQFQEIGRESLQFKKQKIDPRNRILIQETDGESLARRLFFFQNSGKPITGEESL